MIFQKQTKKHFKNASDSSGADGWGCFDNTWDGFSEVLPTFGFYRYWPNHRFHNLLSQKLAQYLKNNPTKKGVV